MKYKIVEGKTFASDLEEKVNELIARGWKPQGGVSTVHYSYVVHYFQAMVKEE